MAALGVDLGEGFWEAVKPNLTKFADMADMARIVTGPVTPVIEDPAFAAAALEVLPDVIDAGAWSAWTTAVKEKTGAKGKGLFMPLRLALTGQAHGPDMAAMAPLIGRDAIVRRLKGEAS
ncbi:Glutamate--tRNA ligase [compost metagenome]